ncbi:ribosome biogenesis protein SPATA5 [Episyrphus balteatus]|uniref:ribosome biogenesis protein SPATA5 n=1 Tax=Episyrphus balteatus TaxID=286459 RepID=UPI002485C881|nr:ribosome biogenesis protein SPATA5 [Episyrphus balteatus]
MPPKSSNKKSQASWFACDKCHKSIISKDRDNHEQNCSNQDNACFAYDYIQDHRLYTMNFTKRNFTIDELNDTPPKFVNNLVFISEGAMKLCGFRIGQPIVIRSRANTELASVVRCAWPISEKFLSTVFFSIEDFETNWQSFINTPISLEKLSKSAEPAKRVCLKSTNQQDLENLSLSDVKLMLKKQMKDSIFISGNKVFLNFYNKQLEFVVASHNSSLIESEITLESELERLSLKDKFFTVVNSTSVEIETKNVESKGNYDLQSCSFRNGDIGGLREQLQKVEESMRIALGLNKLPKGVKVSRGLLLFGPTGCGKTMICEAMANVSSAQVIRINTSELFSKFLGETEKNLTQQIEAAFRHYPQPTLIIVEDIENLCPKQETNETVKRVSVAFLSILDSFNLRQDATRLFVLATTANIENLNAGVRRSGRLDCEVEVPAPSPQARLEILKCHLTNIEHDLKDEFITEVSNVTHGFVGSDLSNLIYTASLNAVKNGRVKIQTDDINDALSQVKPSAMREVLIENPNVKWTDIGGQDDLKHKLKQAIEWPLLYPEKFTRLGIKPPRGILMFGPPGCSKTLIAKALATESKVNFLSIKGPELFSMWVGESERAVREVFRKARQVAPSIIFFDEIDAIGGERGSEGGGTSVKERVLTQLLTELDGVNILKDVTIVAATNRPDMIDKALLRPGRIDRIVYVRLPDAESRREIFKIKLKKMPLAEDVSLDELVARTEGYSGAEIQAVCHEAALKVLENDFDAQSVSWKEFEETLKTVQPRTSPELLRLYDDYLKQS